MTTLKPYQMRGAKAIRRFKGRALLADEMGLGKTIQALYWCLKTTKARPILVICPAFLKLNWQREANMHVGMTSEILEGRSPPKNKKVTGHPITIINYEILKDWRDYIERLDPKVIILDECHYIKNRTSGKKACQRYENSKEICRQAKYVLALSGTPLTNYPSELWTTLNILHPKKYDSFFSFCMRYAKPYKSRWGWNYNGAKNLPELHKNLRELCMIRRLKKDVLKELPAKSRFIVPVEIENAREYRKADEDFLKWLKKQSAAKAKKAKKAQALTRISYLKQLAVKLKMKAVYKWIDNFLESNDGKLIVFMKHKETMELLVKKYGKLAVRVDGSITGRKRQVAVDIFQRSPKKRLFLGNMDAAGVGISLTAASTELFIEFDWSPGKHTQAEDRPHRIGQKEAVMIYYLVGIGTIEEKFCEILQEKQLILDAVLDGAKQSTNIDFFGKLITQMSKRDA